MQRERMKRQYERKFKQYQNKEIKVNYKLVLSAILFFVIIIIKYLPVSQLSPIVNSAVKTNTDYFLMFREIRGVIAKHTLGDKVFDYPLTGEIMSPFGERTNPITFETENHTGIDISAAENTPITAADGGEIYKAEENEYYGKFIMIKHKNDLTTLYGHLNSILKEVGEQVKKGEEIGLCGSTGNSTGAHLHFEIRKDNIPVDPMEYLPNEKD